MPNAKKTSSDKTTPKAPEPDLLEQYYPAVIIRAGSIQGAIIILAIDYHINNYSIFLYQAVFLIALFIYLYSSKNRVGQELKVDLNKLKP
ncbi:MAG: hypothetical protein GF335_02395 [Candidatus Moranbacteria bacterium]|nr:hypothetical protein [Candidatus Moranbacteria bacterium]